MYMGVILRLPDLCLLYVSAPHVYGGDPVHKKRVGAI